jgi:hypothetical protein
MSNTDGPPPATGAPENDFDIDWTKEPTTERERRIRAAVLRKVFDDDGSLALSGLSAVLRESRTPCFYAQDAASDFRESYAKAEALNDQLRAERKQRRLEYAIREVDSAQE